MRKVTMTQQSTASDVLSIVIAGASGDLARKKIYPALFSLYCQGYLPERFHIFGFARSKFDDAEFRRRITEHLTCRYAPGESCGQRMTEFLERCHYASGDYGCHDAMLDLYTLMRDVEGGLPADRLFYIATPPFVFLDVVRAIGDAGLVSCGSERPWSRVVVEKPFGHDRESSDELIRAMAHVFVEHQIYRIDHYLGKEVIQNLLVLRFANLVFEPIWNANFIRSVAIDWKEDLRVEGRGGYFDQYGIIRDVVQNHLLQILSLVAMEPPRQLCPVEIAHEKVRVLRGIPPLKLEDLVIGQYGEAVRNGKRFPAYVDEDGIAADSITPTYAAARMRVDNPRWNGVPFFLTAGKGLDTKETEIRIRFRDVEPNMFCQRHICPDPNELVIRVQPDESIYLSVVNKVPGVGMTLRSQNLDLQYKMAFPEQIPDAYESLLLDVMEGDRSLFIQSGEVRAAWDILTPVLHELERRGVVPERYEFGSAGPAAAQSLLP